ncbi:Crp/Fnr family transcriptional regulator [Methylobacterium planeticum]|uniref:Crp/Fnr family transcriptional regulator n=1 Tax=Methylobacterium planeticum TaxID=2615211 RepID=A0A6N6MSL7_9HYPH|nr:Crp/Fnr family transcriptional regulator [Methylobacterium planeticum]KAB1071633.1 Crp/Fnr family transcriptional regulator [Methylobacterium planeticum]
MSTAFVLRLQYTTLLSERERSALEHLPSEPQLFAPRENIAPPGETDRLALVLSGIAGRYKLHLNGNRRIVSLALPGDLCDIQALETGLRGLPLRALTPCTVASLPRSALTGLAAEHPGIARALWRLALAELSTAREWLVNDSRPAEKRMAHLLCELLVRLRAMGLAGESSFELKLSQVDLAEAIGISFVHVNRILQSLRSSALIELNRPVLSVPDVARLRAFAEFDPTYLQLGGAGNPPLGPAQPRQPAPNWEPMPPLRRAADERGPVATPS